MYKVAQVILAAKMNGDIILQQANQGVLSNVYALLFVLISIVLFL